MKTARVFNADALKKHIMKHKKDGKKVSLTSGSWDMLHVGHMRYIKKAKSYADILVVGVDSDEKIQERKGEDRPVVQEKERLEMLSHLKYIDYLFVKNQKDRSLHLVDIVRPDYLVVSETSQHENGHIDKMKKYCKNIVILPEQAETSTTAKIRRLHMEGLKEFASVLIDTINNLVKNQK